MRKKVGVTKYKEVHGKVFKPPSIPTLPYLHRVSKHCWRCGAEKEVGPLICDKCAVHTLKRLHQKADYFSARCFSLDKLRQAALEEAKHKNAADFDELTKQARSLLKRNANHSISRNST